MADGLIQQSERWISFPFLDRANAQLRNQVLLLVIFVAMAGAVSAFFLIKAPHFFWGEVAFFVAFGSGAFCLLSLWEISRLRDEKKLRVWVDCFAHQIIMGDPERGVRYDAKQYSAVYSRFDMELLRHGGRRVVYVSLTLQGKDGELELARFSSSAMAIEGWSDHAHARQLRKLLAERLGLTNLGVVGNNLPEQIAADRESIESMLATPIAPRAVGVWVRRAMKAVLLILGAPVGLALIVGAVRQRLQYSDAWMFVAAFFFLSWCWIGIDLIGQKCAHKAVLWRTSLLGGSMLLAVACMVAFGGDWSGSIEMFASGLVLLGYWHHARRRNRSETA